MKKLFVSLPMKDKTEEKIRRRMNECKKEVEEILKEEVELLDTFIKEDAPEYIDNAGLWYLGKSLEKMGEADVVYCDEGYGRYRGCVVEFSAAIRYDIPMVICNDSEHIRTIFYKNKWRGFLYTKPLTDSEEKPKTLVMGAKTINMIVDESGLF